MAVVVLAVAGCVEMSSTADPTAAPQAVATAELTSPTEPAFPAELTGASPTLCGRVPPCCPGFIESPDGFCVQEIRMVTTNLHAQYYILSLIYAPPGKASSVNYEHGTGITHKVDVSRSLTNTVGVSMTAPGGSGSASFSATDIHGFSYQIMDNAMSERSVTASGRSNDEIPPDDDIFVIAFGPLIRVTRATVGTNTSTVIYAPDFSNVTYVSVSTGELKNPALMDPYKQSLFADFTAADYANILAFDPRAIGGDVGDPQRYTPVRSMTLQGPVPPNYSDTIGETQTYKHSESHDNTSGYQLEISVKTDVSLTSVFKVQRSISFTYSNTVTNGNSSDQTATVKFATSTHDCTASYTVYYDAMFNTLAFKKNGDSPACH